MILKRCYLTHNDCYAYPTFINGAPTGIVVHDTGAGNPYIKRYVQPRDDNLDKDIILADLGKNTADNHWNKSQSAGESSRYACVHAFIGKNDAGVIEVYETLPYDICCWGVGDGTKGSYNYNPTARIQFEICDDGYKSKKYFIACMQAAAEYCAYLCKMFGFGVSQICNHHESYKAGYGGNHSDTDVWMAKFGVDMNWFRQQVQKELDKEEDMTEAEVQALIDKNKEKVYHYWNEIPGWAYAPLRAMYDKGYFAGASPSDLNIGRTKLECNVQMAAILKAQGILNY